MTTYRTNVRLDDIAASPTNPRKHFAEQGINDLAASIKEHGLITAVLLRTNPNIHPDTPHYELISGERRVRAARIAGLEIIPAEVRDDLSDAALIEIQLIENLQRQDLHPLEEAEGYGCMIRQHGHTADSLAEKIGKSRSYIFGRLKLLDLAEDGRRLFQGGALNPSTALLVARIPTHKLQAKAIEELTARNNYHGDPMSVREAQRWIRDRYTLKLDGAPFPTEDGELIATAGPCGACPKRTGNAPELFDDIDSANVCTDPDCHSAKRIAAAERRAREAGPDVQVVTGEEAEKIMPTYAAESRTHVKLDNTCYDDPKYRTYREIIGEDKSAIILVEDKHKGELVPVVAKKTIASKLKDQGIVTRKETEKDDAKKTKAKVELANLYRDKLFRAIRAKAAETTLITSLIMPTIAHRFMIEAGFDKGGKVAGLWGAIGSDNYSRFDAFKIGLPNLSTVDLALFCLDLALIAEQSTDQYNYQREPECLLAMAKKLDIDAEKLMTEAKEAQKSAQKPAKKPKKQAPATSEEPSTPTEAAQAAGVLPAQNFVFLSGEANPIPAGDPDRRFWPIEAAQAGGAEASQNPAPADAEAKALSSGSDEPNEKPSMELPSFRIGDRVTVVSLKFESGQSVIGKTGVIQESTESFARPGHISYLLVFDDEDFGSFSAFADELQLIENIEKIDIETDEKPSVNNRSSVQYRHPENAELEWSGRGRKPKWVEHCLANGQSLDDLKAQGAAA